MTRGKLIAIIAAVVAAHLGLFYFLAHVRALPKAPHTIPPPNFGYHEEVFEDSKTGEKTIYREFRVSTKLSPRTAQPPTPSPHATTSNSL